jgi:DNA-binding PadR family transcriptional regulator
MRGDRRASALGYNATLVLSALAGGCRYGLEIIERTGLSSGTVYPALRRMEADGLVMASWEEDEEAHRSGRPARRYYALTPAGEEARSEALERVRAQQRILGLAPDQGG